MNELYEIEKLPKNQGYKVFVFDSRLCQRLNKRLACYPLETDFVAERSEGIFRFKESDYKFVLAVLKS